MDGSNILPLFYDNDPSNFYNHIHFPEIVKTLIDKPLSYQQFRELYMLMHTNIINVSLKHQVFFFDFDGTLQMNEFVDPNKNDLHFIFGDINRQKILANVLYLSLTYNRVYVITNNFLIFKIAELLNSLIYEHINVKPNVNLFQPNYTVICTRFINKLETIQFITNKMKLKMKLIQHH